MGELSVIRDRASRRAQRDYTPRSRILHSFLNCRESSSICLSIASERSRSALSGTDAQPPIVVKTTTVGSRGNSEWGPGEVRTSPTGGSKSGPSADERLWRGRELLGEQVLTLD